METLGKIPGTAIVLDKTDLQFSHKFVSALPEPTTDGDKVVILSAKSGGFDKGMLLVNTTAVPAWTQLQQPEPRIGECVNIRSHRIGNKVWIKWQDPSDIYGSKNELVGKWKKTVLLRKLGSYPASINDGVLVVQSTTKNKYSSEDLIDLLPDCITGEWYYRLFTVDQNGSINTSIASAFVPVEFSWEMLSTIIQRGQAQSIFGIGDVIEFSGGTGIYHNLQFVVAGFDCVQLASTKIRSMVVVPRYSLFTDIKFDIPVGEYVFTSDQYVIDATKKYYAKKTNGTYAEVKNLALGTRIPANTYYDKNEGDRAINGTNRYTQSSLRQWLNAETEDFETNLTDEKPILSQIMRIEPAFYNCITPVIVQTAIPNADLSTAAYLQDAGEDKVVIPSSYQVFREATGAMNEGSTVIPWLANYYQGRRLELEPLRGSTDVTWWLRSPDVEATSKVRYVTTTGTLASTSSAVNTGMGLMFFMTLA